MARQDGRRAGQLRPVKITRGYIEYADGSVLIEMGRTKVICCASVEERVPAFLRGTNTGWVTAEYSLLPRSTLSRTPRESLTGRVSGRTQEISRLIGRALRAAVDLAVLGERTITIDCDVIQADGGTRTVSITGGFVALVEALIKLKNSGRIALLPVQNFVAAVSAGMVGGKPILDLTYEEDSSAEVDMNFVGTDSELWVEIQGTAEKRPFDDKDLDALLKLAKKGLKKLVSVQRKAFGELTFPMMSPGGGTDS